MSRIIRIRITLVLFVLSTNRRSSFSGAIMTANSYDISHSTTMSIAKT